MAEVQTREYKEKTCPEFTESSTGHQNLYPLLFKRIQEPASMEMPGRRRFHCTSSNNITSHLHKALAF